MSQVYSTEPSTTGRIILHTSHGYGPIEILLFCKECPTTTRCFLQLCLDGYFDGRIFHRIIDGFLTQTGLYKSSSSSSSGIVEETDMCAYRKHARVEYGSTVEKQRTEASNARIKFNHRGQVATALDLSNSNSNDDNDESVKNQFFITLDEAPFLNQKHVVFGTVSGPTIFNAIRLAKNTPVNDKDHTPSDWENAPHVTSVTVDHHPFHGLVSTNDSLVPWKIKPNEDRITDKEGTTKKKKTRKGKKDFNVLSFGDEMMDQLDNNNRGVVSSHDNVTDKNNSFPTGGSAVITLDATNDRERDDNEVEDGKTEKTDHFSKKRRRPEQEESQQPVHKKDLSKTSDNPSNDESQLSIQRSVEDDCEARKSRQETFTLFTAMQEDLDYHHVGHRHKAELEISQKQSTGDEGNLRPDAGTNEQSSPLEDQNKKGDRGNNSGSALEARRAKYLNRAGAKSLRTTRSLLNDEPDDTLTKLSAFRAKMLQSKAMIKAANNNDSAVVDNVDDDASNVTLLLDDSLAARMAKRDHQGKVDRQREEANDAAIPVYHGQILDHHDDDDDDNDWMRTKFKCKRHMDHSAKDDDEIAISDGRKAVDDHEVSFHEKKEERTAHGGARHRTDVSDSRSDRDKQKLTRDSRRHSHKDRGRGRETRYYR